MIVDEKLKCEITNEGNRKIVRLKGMIDEDASFDAAKKAGGPLNFNFKGVTAINSCGVRNWVNFLKELGSAEITYEQCPPVIVRQMNMVPSFLGNARVNSVFVPYVCSECETEKLVLIDHSKFGAGEANIQDAFPCESCKKGEMELDGHPRQYFAFSK